MLVSRTIHFHADFFLLPQIFFFLPQISQITADFFFSRSFLLLPQIFFFLPQITQITADFFFRQHLKICGNLRNLREKEKNLREKKKTTGEEENYGRQNNRRKKIFCENLSDNLHKPQHPVFQHPNTRTA